MIVVPAFAELTVPFTTSSTYGDLVTVGVGVAEGGGVVGGVFANTSSMVWLRLISEPADGVCLNTCPAGCSLLSCELKSTFNPARSACACAASWLCP